jgi:hypothetical protein
MTLHSHQQLWARAGPLGGIIEPAVAAAVIREPLEQLLVNLIRTTTILFCRNPNVQMSPAALQ